jgi:hypothetical protein
VPGPFVPGPFVPRTISCFFFYSHHRAKKMFSKKKNFFEKKKKRRKRKKIKKNGGWHKRTWHKGPGTKDITKAKWLDRVLTTCDFELVALGEIRTGSGWARFK